MSITLQTVGAVSKTLQRSVRLYGGSLHQGDLRAKHLESVEVASGAETRWQQGRGVRGKSGNDMQTRAQGRHIRAAIGVRRSSAYTRHVPWVRHMLVECTRAKLSICAHAIAANVRNR